MGERNPKRNPNNTWSPQFPITPKLISPLWFSVCDQESEREELEELEAMENQLREEQKFFERGLFTAWPVGLVKEEVVPIQEEDDEDEDDEEQDEDDDEYDNNEVNGDYVEQAEAIQIGNNEGPSEDEAEVTEDPLADFNVEIQAIQTGVSLIHDSGDEFEGESTSGARSSSNRNDVSMMNEFARIIRVNTDRTRLVYESNSLEEVEPYGDSDLDQRSTEGRHGSDGGFSSEEEGQQRSQFQQYFRYSEPEVETGIPRFGPRITVRPCSSLREAAAERELSGTVSGPSGLGSTRRNLEHQLAQANLDMELDDPDTNDTI